MKDHLDSHHLTGDRPPKTRRPVFRMLSAVAALLAASAALGASNTYSTIQFRRGPEVQRTGVVFAVGEPAFTTNNHKLYIGDGVTLGGVGVAMDADVVSAMATVSTQVTATLTAWVNGRGYITGITSNMVVAAVGQPFYAADFNSALSSALTSNMIVSLVGQPFYASQFSAQFISLLTSNAVTAVIGTPLYLITSNMVVAAVGQPFYASQLTSNAVTAALGQSPIYTGGGGTGDAVLAGTNDFTGPITFANGTLNKNGVPVATLNDIYEIVFGGLSNLRPTNTSLPTLTGNAVTNLTVTVDFGTFYSVRPYTAVTNQSGIWVEDWITNGAGYYAQLGTNSILVVPPNVCTGSVLYAVSTVSNQFGWASAVSAGLTVTNGSVAGPPAHWHVVYSGSYLVSADGGINYTTYDVLTAIDGDGTPFTVTVTAVDEGDGHIVSSTLLAAGDYTTKPTDPVSLSGGTGSGAKAQPGVDQMWELFEP